MRMRNTCQTQRVKSHFKKWQLRTYFPTVPLQRSHKSQSAAEVRWKSEKKKNPNTLSPAVSFLPTVGSG